MPENAAFITNMYIVYTLLLKLISCSHGEHHWTLGLSLHAELPQLLAFGVRMPLLCAHYNMNACSTFHAFNLACIFSPSSFFGVRPP